MSTTTTNTNTPEQLAELFRAAVTSDAKWRFLDAVLDTVAARPELSQREVVEMIGDTTTFTAIHGSWRDPGPAGRKAASKLKSIRDELSVVKVWAPGERVADVSFEAHKLLNRFGSKAGAKILRDLAQELGGPGNVTKAAVKARIAALDPDHKPQANGKKPKAAPAAAQAAVPQPQTDDPVQLARMLVSHLSPSKLATDDALREQVKLIVDVYNAYDQRQAAKSNPKAAAPAKPAAAAKPAAKSKAPRAPKTKPNAPAVKAPVVAVAAAKPKVVTPKVAAPVG